MPVFLHIYGQLKLCFGFFLQKAGVAKDTPPSMPLSLGQNLNFLYDTSVGGSP